MTSIDAPEPGSVGPLPPPPPPPQSPRQGARSRWVLASLGAVGLAAAGVFGVLWFQAVDDRDTSRDDLREVRTELEELEADLSSARADTRAAENLARSRDDQLSTQQEELDELTRDFDDARSAMVEFLAFSLELGGGFPGDRADCVADELLEQEGFGVLAEFAEIGASGLDNTDPDLLGITTSLLEAAASCGLGLDAFSVAAGYGDDPALDALWDLCAGGDGKACDDLWFSAPLNSDYERFGGTCGERYASPEVSPSSCELDS